MTRQQKARVVKNERIGAGYYRLSLACEGYDTAAPGQFVMLQVPGGTAPLLRRPFSIHGLLNRDRQDSGIEVLYKVVGAGTKLLSEMREETSVDLLGPLGNGFLLSPPGPRIFLVGGGIGVPPLVFLARTFRAQGFDMSQCHMFLGGRTQEDLLCTEAFTDLGMAVHLTTDDGSAGDHCLITSPVETHAAEAPPDMIYACGPIPMLSCLVGISKSKGIRCQVSIESMMACGIGACLGCAVAKADDDDAYYHVCKDGPVFETDQVRF